MKLGIMQPYFFPYIGYFQLINYVDTFILYDNVQYIQGGWVNRNKIGTGEFITLPIEKKGRLKNINEIMLSKEYEIKRDKILKHIKETYKKSPFFGEVITMIEMSLPKHRTSLWQVNLASLLEVIRYLKINTHILIASNCAVDHGLKGVKKVLRLCKYIRANEYINAIGGTALYDKKVFEESGIKLGFLKTKDTGYKNQGLSIIDLMMNIERTELINMLKTFEVI